MLSAGNHFDRKERGRASNNMLSPRQESHMVSKSGSNSKGRREWSQVSSSPAVAPACHGTIRVIHIFAPKIIKTDVANFRELVQRLTGNTRRSSSSSKSKRGARSISSSSPRAKQILSQYCNATQIFASSNRVEYTIPRSSEPYFSPPSRTDFNKEEEDVKPAVRLRESPSYIDCSGSSSDQSCCSPFPPAEVTSPYFHGRQDPSSVHVNGNSDMPSKNLKSCSNQQQQKQQGLSPKPIMVDPFQSLSGYKEKLSPTPQRLSTTTFPLFDDRNHCNMFASRFSDMDILTGLVTPGPIPEFPLAYAMPPQINNSSDFTFQSSLLNNANSLCRFSVQSPLRRGISQLFENF